MRKFLKRCPDGWSKQDYDGVRMLKQVLDHKDQAKTNLEWKRGERKNRGVVECSWR